MRGLCAAAALVLLLGAGAARAQDEGEEGGDDNRTSISGDPFGDDELPEGEDAPAAAPAPSPSPTPSPTPSAAPPAPSAPPPTSAPAVAPPEAPSLPPVDAGRILVLIRPAGDRDRVDAVAIGDAAAGLLARARGGGAVQAQDALDPDRALRARRARDEALALARRGAEALDALDLEIARDSAEEAALALAALPGGDREVDQALQESLLGMAVAALYDNDVLRADGAFVALAALLASGGRDTPLLADLRRYPSKVIARFESTRADIEARPTGRVAVRSTPEGATVRIDGIERGRAPTEIGGLAEGLHVVALEGVGMVTTTALVDVVASDVVPVERALSGDPLAEALAAVPPSAPVADAAAWARALGVRWLFLGETTALGAVRGSWIEVDAAAARASVDVALGGGVEGSARKLVDAIDAAERARLAPVVAEAPPDEGDGLTDRWWFWAGVGGAVALAAAGALIAVSATGDGLPRGTAIFGF